MTCGQKYKYHYIDKLREKVTSSALLFGSAIDEALNSALIAKREGTLTDDWTPYLAKFEEFWTNGFINKKKESLLNNEKLVYAQADMDWDLLTDFELQELTTLGKGDPKDKFKAIAQQKSEKGWLNLQPTQRQFYNYCNWLSLRHKGKHMLEAYRVNIIPRIKQVLEVQMKLDFDNEEGDSILGYLDCVVVWEDDTILVVDNKTSARDYELDSVRTSPQLGLYKTFMREVYGDNIKAAFFVIKKAMAKNKKKICDTCNHDGSGSRARSCDNTINGKRCPGQWITTVDAKAEVQVIIDDIPDRVETMIVENFDSVNKLINTGIFTKNFNSCKGKFGLCPYYNLCWNDSKEGLDTVE